MIKNVLNEIILYDPAKKGKMIKSTFYGDNGKYKLENDFDPVTGEQISTSFYDSSEKKTGVWEVDSNGRTTITSLDPGYWSNNRYYQV